MRPSTNETFAGGRPRKASSANGSESIFSTSASVGALGSSTSSVEELLNSPHSPVSSMTYFLADGATVNNAIMGSSSDSGGSGVFGVHSMESSSGSGTLARKSTRSKLFDSEPNLKRLNRRASILDMDDERDLVDTKKDKSIKGGEPQNPTVPDLTPLDNNPDEPYSPRESESQTQPLQPGTPIRLAFPTDSPFLNSPMTRSCDGFSDTAIDDLHLNSEIGSMLGSPLASSAPSPPPKPKERLKMITSDTVPPPQFIMPTIRMPTRRPFTERGKNIPRLKILVAGDSGIGKSSFIKAIIQTCEDIVHVDPVPTNTSTAGARGSSSTSSFYTINDRSEGGSTKAITEIYASTKPYPHWWSEHEDSKVLKRRKSTAGDIVLERNVCFVDTPGYGSATSFLECVTPVVRYVETQMERTQAILSNGDGGLLSLLSGNGTPQVDIVFYVILHRLKPVDIEYIRQLTPLTNVLPVIAKSDSLNEQQIRSLKLSILNDLNAAGVRPFLYGKTYDDIYHKLCGNCAPFAISSAISGDQENMDASLLMSPDYAPPLVGTELDDLINHTFDPSNIAWLKHAAAKKFLSWKSRQTFLSAPASTSASVYTSFGPSAVGSAPSSLIQASNGRNTSFALARVADHTQREERLAHARLAKWAHDLQRSLRAEKERYDRLAKGERALWLTERLGECVANGQLVPISTAMTKRAEQSHGEAVPEIWGSITARDPIGVLGAYERLTRGAAYVGCGGVLAAIVAAVWAIKEYWPEWVTAHQ